MSRSNGGADSAGDRWHRVPRGSGISPAYRDGCYEVSSAGEASTWAICHGGKWGVVYECSGEQVLSAWVDETDIPLHVLAAALHGAIQ